MDFVSDRLEDGHSFRMLTVVLDVFTREWLALHADRHLSGRKVGQVLERVDASRGLPKEINVDNGTPAGTDVDDGRTAMEGFLSKRTSFTLLTQDAALGLFEG